MVRLFCAASLRRIAHHRRHRVPARQQLLQIRLPIMPVAPYKTTLIPFSSLDELQGVVSSTTSQDPVAAYNLVALPWHLRSGGRAGS